MQASQRDEEMKKDRRGRNKEGAREIKEKELDIGKETAGEDR